MLAHLVSLPRKADALALNHSLDAFRENRDFLVAGGAVADDRSRMGAGKKGAGGHHYKTEAELGCWSHLVSGLGRVTIASKKSISASLQGRMRLQLVQVPCVAEQDDNFGKEAIG